MLQVDHMLWVNNLVNWNSNEGVYLNWDEKEKSKRKEAGSLSECKGDKSRVTPKPLHGL